MNQASLPNVAFSPAATSFNRKRTNESARPPGSPKPLVAETPATDSAPERPQLLAEAASRINASASGFTERFVVWARDVTATKAAAVAAHRAVCNGRALINGILTAGIAGFGRISEQCGKA